MHTLSGAEGAYIVNILHFELYSGIHSEEDVCLPSRSGLQMWWLEIKGLPLSMGFP